MQTRNQLIKVFTICLILVSVLAPVFAQDKVVKKNDMPGKTIVKVYYFHTTARCTNCKKFEKWSKEVIDEQFKKQVSTGYLVYEKYNIQEEQYKHFQKHYQLLTKSLILSRQNDAKEQNWKNLDKIWTTVSDELKFKAYVAAEIQAMLEGKKI